MEISASSCYSERVVECLLWALDGAVGTLLQNVLQLVLGEEPDYRTGKRRDTWIGTQRSERSAIAHEVLYCDARIKAGQIAGWPTAVRGQRWQCAARPHGTQSRTVTGRLLLWRSWLRASSHQNCAPIDGADRHTHSTRSRKCAQPPASQPGPCISQ